jgi:hypothetical protein
VLSFGSLERNCAAHRLALVWGEYKVKVWLDISVNDIGFFLEISLERVLISFWNPHSVLFFKRPLAGDGLPAQIFPMLWNIPLSVCSSIGYITCKLSNLFLLDILLVFALN